MTPDTTETMKPNPQVQQLQRMQEGGASLDEVLEYFDSLPAVQPEDMLGSWAGSDIPTGGSFDGLLKSFHWHGKRFEGPDGAHPLVMTAPSGERFNLNPTWIPASMLTKRTALLRHPLVGRAFSALGPLLRTDKPQARLRTTVYRGVATATMCYDALPIHDVFRKVDADTLIGAMDMRGLTEPYMFVLRRETPEVKP